MKTDDTTVRVWCSRAPVGTSSHAHNDVDNPVARERGSQGTFGITVAPRARYGDEYFSSRVRLGLRGDVLFGLMGPPTRFGRTSSGTLGFDELHLVWPGFLRPVIDGAPIVIWRAVPDSSRFGAPSRHPSRSSGQPQYNTPRLRDGSWLSGRRSARRLRESSFVIGFQ